jgi:hypothetical protein
MTPTRFTLLRARIAKILHSGAPMLTPESQVLDDLRSIYRIDATELEFNHVILRMEQAKQIIRHQTQDEGVKTKLSELGEAEFPE